MVCFIINNFFFEIYMIRDFILILRFILNEFGICIEGEFEWLGLV